MLLEQRKSYLLSEERNVTFSDWQLKQEFADDHFELEFPPGVKVSDEISGDLSDRNAK